MINVQTELKDIETLKDMIIANKARAINSKDAYLDAHGVKMPYYLRMVVDGNYKTSEALLNNSSFLLDEIQKLNEHVSNLEDIIQNGPGSKAKPQPGTPPELAGVPQGEKADWTPPKQEDGFESKGLNIAQAWIPTEQDLKGLSTDGRLD